MQRKDAEAMAPAVFMGLITLGFAVYLIGTSPFGEIKVDAETVDVTEVIETYWEPVETAVETETETETELETEAETYAEEDFYDDLELLAYTVMAESGNQCEEGKRLVIDTILNRVDSKYFPDTIKDVVYAKGQFAVVRNGSLYKTEPTEDIYQLIREEIHERTNSKVVYFKTNGFHTCGEPYKQVGAHYFSYIRRSLQDD